MPHKQLLPSLVVVVTFEARDFHSLAKFSSVERSASPGAGYTADGSSRWLTRACRYEEGFQVQAVQVDAM
jgi:hypothetical protein